MFSMLWKIFYCSHLHIFMIYSFFYMFFIQLQYSITIYCCFGTISFIFFLLISIIFIQYVPREFQDFLFLLSSFLFPFTLFTVANCDMVKHELRVTSWKFKSTSWNLRVTSQIHELRLQVYELRVQIHEYH